MITFLLALIGTIGTLFIVAYLRQVEDKMPELLKELEAPVPECPVCHLPHEHSNHRTERKSFRRIKGYCQRKRKAAFGYCKSKK